ncbi:MAG: DNA cytosine methyltransferase [Betaproteobacteria bacterium]|nr:DNA cytosine methyltransferase [Betaproteobacteria bacterium]
MNVGSLFSGIGGLDEGLRRAGFEHAFFCESDAWRRSILAARFPGIPIYEDVCEVGGDATGSPARQTDLLCGGFP